jgi:hypothetical protein
MDENPRGWSGPEDLRTWLAAKGIPVGEWGAGGAKRVDDLWAELRAGDSVLTDDDPPRRRTSFVAVVIRRGDKILTETAQELATGEIRERHWPPGEKKRPDEAPETAAFRCLEEELGVPRELCRVVSVTPLASQEKISLSYPGLTTLYSSDQVEMEVLGLPGKFETPESGDSAVVRHFWDWRPPTEP